MPECLGLVAPSFLFGWLTEKIKAKQNLKLHPQFFSPLAARNSVP